MYLLDTNVISEPRKPAGRVDPHVAAWMAGQDELLLALSSVTIFELDLGVRRVEHRDPRQGLPSGVG